MSHLSSPTRTILPLIFLVLAGCSAPKPVVLTAADNRRTVEITRGADLLVSLESNRTTGFSWTLAGAMSGPLAVVGEPIYVTDPASTGAVGVGGIETWRFRAASPGEERLQFEYRRPFEKELTPERSVTIDVRVR